MLERPDLQDERLITFVREDFGVPAGQVAFLPLGADLNTAVYRVVAEDDTNYFLKLRSGMFDEASVTLPKVLGDQGIAPIIPPLTTRSGQLWATLDAFTAILYPFVTGCDAYAVALSDRQWADFGAAVKKIHTAVLPPELSSRLRQETYDPWARQTVTAFLTRVATDAFDDPIAVELAAFLKARRGEVLDLVERAGQLAQALRALPLEFTLCHADIHAGNLLIDAGGAFFIVDWDNPILAPKERDLMAIGGGLMGNWRPPQEEELLFYRGYGEAQIDARALAYYRYERIIQDIAVYCEQLLLTPEGGDDRAQSLRYLMSNFLPGNTIALAYRSERMK